MYTIWDEDKAGIKEIENILKNIKEKYEMPLWLYQDLTSQEPLNIRFFGIYTLDKKIEPGFTHPQSIVLGKLFTLTECLTFVKGIEAGLKTYDVGK